MNHKIPIWSVLLIVIVLGFLIFGGNRHFKSQIKTLETQRDSLKNEFVKVDKIVDSLILETDKEKIIYKTIYRERQDVINEGQQIINNTYSLDDKQLDSIITNHRHPKRTED